MKIKIVLLVLLMSASVSCKKTEKRSYNSEVNGEPINLKYAKGFSVVDHDDYKVLTITQPWPDAKVNYKYALISEDHLDQVQPELNQFDAVIPYPVSKIVVTSTTHIPSLELLGVEKSLVGFPETNYVSSEKTRNRIKDGKVKELGKNEAINTEILLALRPDLVIGFGVEGVNKTFETVKKNGIPVVYNGDWVEASALAKAEWIKFFGVLFNKESAADSIFNRIEADYHQAKNSAAQAKNRPSVLSGAMHKEIWYLPSGSSPEAQYLKDANVNYLWEDSNGSGSLALSYESVLNKAKDADLWLNPSYYSSIEALKKSNSLYTNFEAFKSRTIYSFVNSKGPNGGVLYYELGTARPDLVLKDIIKICHPELLIEYKPHFLEKLK